MSCTHGKAHQDDTASFEKLSRKAQLNCICDHKAKQIIAADGIEGAVSDRMFPLEPISLFVWGEKMTCKTSEQIPLWEHQLAWLFCRNRTILSLDQYDSVDWKLIHCTLHDLPQLFQVWATKHVHCIVGTMKFLAHQDDRSPLCPSCQKCKELCKHIAQCPEAGRSLAFEQLAQAVGLWLKKK